MLERVKILLACLSYVVLISLIVVSGLLLQSNMPVVAVVVYVCALLLLGYLYHAVVSCCKNGVSIAQILKGNFVMDVFIMIVFVQACMDDLNEEKWWPVAMLASGWAIVDFLRCLLDVFKNGEKKTKASENISCNRMLPNMKFENSLTFKFRSYICCFVAWGVLMCFFYLRHGFDNDFIIDMIWYFAVVMAIVSISVLGTRVSVGRDTIMVYQHGNVAGKKNVHYCEIVNVVVDRSLLWGPRMTIFYGNGKNVVAYPADIKIVANFLRKQHVNVENKL